MRDKHRRNQIGYGVTLILILALYPIQSYAQISWSTYRHESPKFRFLHPPDWIFGPARGPNVKATLFAPDNKPRANCNIVVRSVSETKTASQSILNAEMSSTNLTEADWQALMGEKWPDFRVIESKQTKIDNQPAFYAVEEHLHQTVDRKTFIKGTLLMTFTPGYAWVFTCAAKGNTLSEARESYKYWNRTFQRIFGSLVFESLFDQNSVPLSSQASPHSSFTDVAQLVYFERPQEWEMLQMNKETYSRTVLMSPDKKYHIQFILKEVPVQLRSKTVEELNDIDIDALVKQRKATKHSSAKIDIADTTGVATWLSYHESKSNLHWAQYSVYVKHKEMLLTINCIAAEKEKNAALSHFEKYKPETSAVLKSIKFIGD